MTNSIPSDDQSSETTADWWDYDLKMPPAPKSSFAMWWAIAATVMVIILLLRETGIQLGGGRGGCGETNQDEDNQQKQEKSKNRLWKWKATPKKTETRSQTITRRQSPRESFFPEISRSDIPRGSQPQKKTYQDRSILLEATEEFNQTNKVEISEAPKTREEASEPIHSGRRDPSDISAMWKSLEFSSSEKLTPKLSPRKTETPRATAICLPCMKECEVIQSQTIRIQSLIRSCPIREWNNSGTCMLLAWCLACTC
jgi:hypothetical protein